MITKEDELNIIMNRADKYRERNACKKRIASLLATSVLFLIGLVAVFSAIKPSTPIVGGVGEPAGEEYGSLILNSAAVTYVIVALLAFLLGAFIMLLCFEINKLNRIKPGVE